MNEVQAQIFGSVLGLIGVIVGAVFTYLAKSRKAAVEEAKREQQQADQHQQVLEKLNRVEKRLDEHNHYAEKFESVDNKITSVEKTLLTVSKDIEFMKQNNCYLNNPKSHARID